MNNFNDVLISPIDSIAPLVSKRVKQHCQPPWFFNEILDAIQKRENAKRKKLYDKYKMWRNKLLSLVRKHKQDYYAKVIEKCNGQTSKLWKVLNNVTCRNKPCPEISCLNIENKCTDKPEDIANSFDQYFTSVAESLKSTIPHQDYVVTEQFQKFLSDKDIKQKGFSIPLISENEVVTWLKSLNPHKATGSDRLSAKLLGSVGPGIAQTLQDIVNTRLFQLGNFLPWKEAVVKPLHKGGDNKIVNNYRPISILCVASKLIERHVYSSLYKYFVNNDLFCNNQSGFRKNYSCHTCLTNIVERWLSDMNKGHIVASVELDFSKAFDVLDHNILLQKLECYGCDNLSLDWFGSYLGQRSQSVKLQGTLSDSMPLKCDVPQGSTLGPLLFVIFTNDMHFHVLNSSLDSYADDSNVSKSGRSLQDLVTGLQEDLNAITDWCNAYS